MSHTTRLAIFLGVGVLLITAILPAVSAGLAALGLEVTPYRLWERLALFVLLGSAFLVAPKLSTLRRDEHPFEPIAGRWSELTSGFAGAVCCSTLVVCCLIALGPMRFSKEFNWADDGLKLLVTVPLGALVVAFLEEFGFRHLLFQSFKKDRGTTFAVLTTSLLFAAVHFFHVSRSTLPPEDSAFSGFLVLQRFLANVLVPQKQLAFVGLFLLGLVFALARLLTGRLYLAIGIHAGFIFFNKMDGPFTSWGEQVPPWWLGHRHYTAGVPGWIVFGAAAGLLAYLVRRRERQGARMPSRPVVPIPVTYDSNQ